MFRQNQTNMKIEIKTKEELKYVMDFYNIPFVPIRSDGKDMGKVTREMKYVAGSWKYNSGWEYLAFECAFEQISDVISLKEKINQPFEATDVLVRETMEYVYPDSENGTPRHHVYPIRVTKRTEKTVTGTMDEVFVKHYKANNSLRYCNGEWWEFKDKEVQEMYNLWLRIMPEGRSFNLYYGNGIVD